MNEMIARVAAALQREQTVHGPNYERLARAAIEAMREPLPSMSLAGGAEITSGWVVTAPDAAPRREAPQYVGANGADRVWRAMLDDARA